MPTMSIAQNEFAFDSGCANVAITAGIFTSASVSTIISR